MVRLFLHRIYITNLFPHGTTGGVYIPTVTFGSNWNWKWLPQLRHIRNGRKSGTEGKFYTSALTVTIGNPGFSFVSATVDIGGGIDGSINWFYSNCCHQHYRDDDSNSTGSGYITPNYRYCYRNLVRSRPDVERCPLVSDIPFHLLSVSLVSLHWPQYLSLVQSQHSPLVIVDLVISLLLLLVSLVDTVGYSQSDLIRSEQLERLVFLQQLLLV